MITIISPAKNMRKSEDWKELIDEGELSCPRLYEKSNEVLAHMKEYITEEIRAIMKIKEDLAQLNYCRFQRMKPISCCKNSKDGKKVLNSLEKHQLYLPTMEYSTKVYRQKAYQKMG